MHMRIFGTVLAFTAALAASAPGARAAESLAQLPHKSWTAIADLQSTPVWAIAQDREGYIWLGVRAGLVRFDGTSFVSWEALNGAELPERDVQALHASPDGALWVGFGNAGGVSRIRGRAVHTYEPGDGLPSGPIWALLEDRQGTVWAGGPYGVSRFRDGRWERVGSAQGIGDRVMLFDVYEDAAGDLWLGTVAGLFRRVPAADTFERIESAGRVIRSVTSDAAGSIWIGGELAGFREANLPELPPVPALTPGMVMPVLRDRRGHLWGGTTSEGVTRIPDRLWGGDSAVERFTPQDGLSGERILALHEDHAGNIWIGTDGGLDYLAVNYPNGLLMRTELAGQMIMSLGAGENGAVWAGTPSGLYQLSDRETRLYRGAGGLAGYPVNALHLDKRGAVWAASPAGLARVEDGRLTQIPLPDGVTLFRVTTMTSDADGGLWLCDATGLYRFHDGALTDYSGLPAVAGRTPIAAYTDSLDRVWIGFAGGGLLSFIDGQPREYPDDDDVTAGLVSAFLEDSDGTLWIGSHRGLARLEQGRFVGLNDRTRPGGSAVIGITQDDEGLLWVATTSHILRLSSREFAQARTDPSYRFTVLNEWDLPAESPGWWWLGYPVSARTTDGELWFATDDGAAVVDPGQIGDPEPSAVRVDRVRAGERMLTPDGGLRVPGAANRLEIEYSAPAFDVPARFRYMLEGFDREWVEVGAFRQAFYTNLPPREYRFRVAASYSGARWVEAQPWDFAVLPTVYETPAFRAGLVLTLVLAVVGVWRLRLRRVRQEFALVLGERARVGREVHDTLLQGMAGVAMQVHAVSESLDDSQTQTRAALNRARDALEHYMREARRSIWELRGPSMEPLELPAALDTLGERLTAGTGVGFTLRVRGVPRRCATELKQQLLRVSGEAISNAVQHAMPSEIAVELSYEDDSVRVCVRDDGLGFDIEEVEREPARHWGLAGMRERAAQLGAALEVASVPSQGTRIEITAPRMETE
ncbi:MAG: hypothetical protein J4F30_08295 [Acidobacteria bacterium]|nr:hypothetical protein [Acidobacteriota bacterium]